MTTFLNGAAQKRHNAHVAFLNRNKDLG